MSKDMKEQHWDVFGALGDDSFTETERAAPNDTDFAPCPFCGGVTPDTPASFHETASGTFSVRCQHCGACGPDGKSFGRARDHWGLSQREESVIYDALASLLEYAPTVVKMVNASADGKNYSECLAITHAYKSGFYAPCIKISTSLGPEAIARGEARHAQIKAEAARFFAERGTKEGNLLP